MKKEAKYFLGLVGIFLCLYHLPVEAPRFQGALIEAVKLVKWYAREHVLLCLVPAFFIAGAIGVFISQNAVMKYFGPKASKWLSYSVASVSGTVLAVCSCTVLPLFGGIYMRGAGLGPAVAFLYSGPAINVLAIVLTARILGWELGVARAVGAVVFSVVIGLLMHLIFLKEEREKAAKVQDVYLGEDEKSARPLWKIAVYFFSMVGILVFANWGSPNDWMFRLTDGSTLRAAVVAAPHGDAAGVGEAYNLKVLDGPEMGNEVTLPVERVAGRDPTPGVWATLWRYKWPTTWCFAAVFGVCLWRFFGLSLWKVILAFVPAGIVALVLPGYPVAAFAVGSAGVVGLTFVGGSELKDWRDQSWGFAKQILPLLMMGVVAAGFFLGSPEGKDAGIVPNAWIQALVGDSPGTIVAMIGGDGAGVPGWLVAIWPIWTNLFASVTGALMYFATLTEVPILRGLLDSGMGQGPALALLLAGPALSLPNMLVINSILGPKKTLTFIGLVVGMATISGILFGLWMG